MSFSSAPLASSCEPDGARPDLRFADLDDALIAAEPGILVVRAPEEDHGPLFAHVARRLRASHGLTVEVTPRGRTSTFREAATQLGIGALPCDPSACAAAIARAQAVIVSSLPREGSWDEAVACELARHPRTLLVFATTSAVPSWATAAFDIGDDLTTSEKLRWLTAMAHESKSLLRGRDLRGLEDWWEHARTVREGRGRSLFAGHSSVSIPADGRELSAAAIDVVTCVAVARRSIPLAAFDRTKVDGRVLEDLVAAGVIAQNGAAVVFGRSVDVAALEAQASSESRELTVQMLLGAMGAFEHDPWACARAAELLVEVRPLEADAAMARAVRLARDARLNAEIEETWFAAVEPLSGELGLELRLRAADRALGMGKAHDAQRWIESVTGSAAYDPRVRLAMARVQVQLGDLVSARVILDQIAAMPVGEDIRASVAVERGEMSCIAGDLEAAVADAELALGLALSARTRLAARSILGKVLLARGAWDEADEHFAADALAAHGAGETTAELRARLNRGIVLISKGLLDEARKTLLRVLEDGERFTEDRACAFALSNLGLVAYRQRDYVGALSFWERTIAFRDALGGRMATALEIGNLAELRLRLGLVDNADHAIRFGWSMAGQMAPARAAQFKLVAAQVALARGFTDVAHREVASAMVHARSSGDVEYVGQTAIIGARIAFSDGDVRRAEEWITIATDHVMTARSTAEVAMLRTMHLRALGRPSLATATEALTLARAAGEDDLLIDVYALVAAASRDEGDLEAAQLHCSRAIAIRDRVAAALPPDTRTAFLSKPEMILLARIQSSLSDAAEVESEAVSDAMPSVRSPLSRSQGDAFIGGDPQMRSLEVAIRKAARSDSTILVHGESGTGKELVARALHSASSRASGPLVVLNCAALVETLLLSELFGHEKGAFTGATTRKRGRFEIAEGGTLFLDEIGDISPRTQVALLRILQEKTFERVGGTTSIHTNARVICATHRDLRAMVERGEFREDLYYRIRGITLEVPPLRARTGDIPRLAQHLLTRIAVERGGEPKEIRADALDLLIRHRWPGNVRELENVLRAATVFAEGNAITVSDLLDVGEDFRRTDSQPPPSWAQPSSPTRSLPPPLLASVHAADDEEDSGLPAETPQVEADTGVVAAAYAQVRQRQISLYDMKRQIERECITRALDESNGNITRAATLLGMKRPRLSQLAKQYGLSAASSEDGQ